jgi:single-strand DNA-binding protein
MQFNKVFLGGNLTRDPELRYSQSGKAYVKFGMAVNERFTRNGEKCESTTFVDLTAFGKTGEAIAKYLKKGDPIFIDGKLDFSTWVAQDGGNRSKLAVIVNGFQFVGSKRETDAAASAPADSDTVPF